MRALCYAQTNIGSGRDNNEDNYYCNGTFKRDPAIPVAEAAAEQESRRLIYGVFDGMGGEANGEQAALLCAQTLHQCSSDEPFDALDFFRRANVAVCDMIAASGQIGGSTAATVHLTGNRAYCCNVGDSRIYLQRGRSSQSRFPGWNRPRRRACLHTFGLPCRWQQTRCRSGLLPEPDSRCPVCRNHPSHRAVDRR